ncbi:hypothetical protein PG997_013582 [Apiospora hydei]|uniref:Autophagy-related protein 1 n=1 Tax=Apiospora hydei TaxID=1337664 RepID=A0ABR1V6L5_9PEZI
MSPQIRSWGDFSTVWEEFDKDGQFLCTKCALYGKDDHAYLGRLGAWKKDIRPEQFETALQQIPDADIYPELSPEGVLTVAPENLAADVFIKRPSLTDYEFFKGETGSGLSQLRDMLLDEAKALEAISQHQVLHPNIVRYHGCRVQRGRVTGIVLDRIDGYDLWKLLKYQQGGGVDKEPFMKALASAVEHLHNIGFSHNDLNPRNVMVDKNGRPVLVDFGSCRRTGQRMGASGGSTGWKDEKDQYLTSENHHDTFSLEKINQWLNNPTFG